MSYWIIANEKPTEPHFYYFKKSFDACDGARLTAKMSGDSRYQLFINGVQVSEGPCQGSEYLTYYEEEDLTPYLKEGKNTLLAKVVYATEGNFQGVYRRDNPAFWFDGVLECGGRTEAIGTDKSWSCEREDACVFKRALDLHKSIPPFENWLGDSRTVPVEVCALYIPALDKKCFNDFGHAEKYVLTPRIIPQMETREAVPMQEVRVGKGFIELDAGIYTTAKLNFSFKARKGERIKLLYSECYSVKDKKGAAGHLLKGLRDDCSEGMELCGVEDIIYATGDEQSFSPFWYRTFRFIRIEFESELEIRDISYMGYFYPLECEGSFECSDERFNKLWDISKNTVLCCMHEQYVDCPFYEQQQYQMDSALEMLFTFRMSRDGRMPYKSLLDLAHSQREDGLLQAKYPAYGDIQIIPNFTLFWVFMLRDYLRYTGDKKRVMNLTGTMDKALCAFLPYMTEDGLIGKMPYWKFVDWVPAWERGEPTGAHQEPLTVSSLIYAAALEAAADISRAVGRTGLALDYTLRAADIINSVNRLCYDSEIGLYRDTPTAKRYSQHTTLWAVLSGAVGGDEAGALIDRTFDGHADVKTCTFSMSHYMFRALELSDRYKYAPRQLEGWMKMLELNCTTWCENPDNPRSECHGWSSAPIYEFSSVILGVRPTADGFTSVEIRPYIEGFGLEYAKGSVPTPMGNILVGWEKKDGRLLLDVTLPCADIEAKVVLPDGSVLEQKELNRQYSCNI